MAVGLGILTGERKIVGRKSCKVPPTGLQVISSIRVDHSRGEFQNRQSKKQGIVGGYEGLYGIEGADGPG